MSAALLGPMSFRNERALVECAAAGYQAAAALTVVGTLSRSMKHQIIALHELD
jgi:hypothetical protein